MLCAAGCGERSTPANPLPRGETPPGMVWIPGGEFTLGSDAPVARADERPPHRARVHGFWIDATEVTNAQFRAFVGATGYVTTAERAPTLDEIMQQVPPGTPPPPPEALVPASLVFTPPQREVSLADPAAWWQIVPGADWQHPSGPQSSIEGLDELPVVHVSWHDAVAYAGWAEKRLPTEAEWECAARGGRENQVYSWGDEPPSEENPLANIWHGRFPTENTRADGFAALAPVRSFPPNGYGLYDVAGNVWEWCSDWYRADTYRMRAAHGLAIDPQGPETSLDPNDPYAPKRVQRGGSFLCHASYCLSYRPSARMGGAPDTGACHVGFRCAKDAREGAASGR